MEHATESTGVMTVIDVDASLKRSSANRTHAALFLDARVSLRWCDAVLRIVRIQASYFGSFLFG